MYCLRSPFLNIGIVTPVCQFLECCHTSTQLDTLALTRKFHLQSALLTSRVRFYLHQQLFQILLIAVATSVAMKTSSSPIYITSCVSRVNAFTGFKRSSKYSPIVKGFYSHLKNVTCRILDGEGDTRFLAT